MKSKILLCIVVLIMNNLYADDFEDFRRLSADGKIQRILEEYRYERRWNRLRFSQYATILTENPEENIPVLFVYFEKLPMLPTSENDRAFDLIDSILWQDFFKLLNRDELNRLATIYQRKIYEYLETYRVIDARIFSAEAAVELIRNNRDIFSIRNIGRTLYKKYTELGYKDLQLIYDPKETQGMTNTKFKEKRQTQ